jgi:hypothetical protein
MRAGIPLVHEHHELRTGGPYRIVRHPIYTGLLGLVLGGMPACGFGVWIVFLAVAVPWLLRRVRIEDGMMADRFGASYDAYRARVPALVPWTRPAPAGPRAVGSRQGWSGAVVWLSPASISVPRAEVDGVTCRIAVIPVPLLPTSTAHH